MIFDDNDIENKSTLEIAKDWIDDNVSTVLHYGNNVKTSELLDITQNDGIVFAKGNTDIYINSSHIPFFIKFVGTKYALIYTSKLIIDLGSLTTGKYNNISISCRNSADIIWPYEKNISIKTLIILNKFDLKVDIPEHITIDNLDLRNIKSIDFIDVNRYKNIMCDKVSAEALTKYILNGQGFKGGFVIV